MAGKHFVFFYFPMLPSLDWHYLYQISKFNRHEASKVSLTTYIVDILDFIPAQKPTLTSYTLLTAESVITDTQLLCSSSS